MAHVSENDFYMVMKKEIVWFLSSQRGGYEKDIKTVQSNES
jgi:hypothetical protein